MTFRNEAAFQDWFLKQLRAIPCSWWTKLNDKSTIGLPDIIGGAGQCFAIELKVNAKLTKLQKYTLERMEKAGFKTFVARPANAADVLEAIYRAASSRLAGVSREQDRQRALRRASNG